MATLLHNAAARRHQVAHALVAGAVAIAVAVSMASAPKAQASPSALTKSLGVYAGAASPAEVSDFASWAGTSATYAEDFLAGDSWSTIESPTWWLDAWAGSPYRMVWGVPIIPATGGTLAQGASGAYNDHFKKLAENLVDAGQGSAILRLGWEFGGGWYRWAVKTPTDAANYAAYWRQIVTTMRTVAPDLAFDWNPIWGWQPVNPEAAYPGDAYVTYIGVDVYDQSWAQGWQDPVARWNDFLSAQWGLAWHRDFAAEHGKPMSFPEWGLSIRSDGHGGGDNPYFISMMRDWIAQNNVAYHVYFEFDASDGRHSLESGAFPQSAATFRQLFAAGTDTGTPPPSSGGGTTTTGGGGAAGADPLGVVSWSPGDDATETPVSTSVTAAFSEPLDPATITTKAFHIGVVNRSKWKQVRASASYDPVTGSAVLTPLRPLREGTAYRVELVAGRKGVRSLSGNRLESKVSWVFVTAPRTSSSTR